jgi:hypothetical protein
MYALWIFDDTPRFFFGDSASYLATRWHAYLPDDRSWLYGLTIHFLMRMTDSLSSALLVQGALYAAALSCLATVLARQTHTRWVGFLFCVVGALDPLAVYYVRNILTDVPAASIFFFVLLGFHQALFAERFARAFFAAGFVFVAGVVLLMLRMAYLPTMFGLCLAFWRYPLAATSAPTPIFSRFRQGWAER